MAKVKIQGHASGTGVLTVTAPNTSTDRTITLPDATGTLATTADTTDLDGAITINESGADVDFRVESNNQANMLVVDGGNDAVGIGIGSPTVPLQVRTALSSVTQSTPETVLLLETTAGTGDMAVGNGTRILFKISDDETNPSVGASIDAVRADGDDSISSTDLVFSTSQNDETLDEALRVTNDGRGLSDFTAHAWGKISCQGTPALIVGHNVSSITDVTTGRYKANYTNNSSGDNSVTISGQNNSYYDEIYYVSIDQCDTTLASFGCSRSDTSAGWFDTYKMTFVTFAT